MLSTHLTFEEIGDRLGVSRYTVKSQAIAIYRKLAVSSRGEAIDRAIVARPHHHRAVFVTSGMLARRSLERSVWSSSPAR
jgi:DNA-directed RNA polymerase specialized sigma24 family protein